MLRPALTLRTLREGSLYLRLGFKERGAVKLGFDAADGSPEVFRFAFNADE